MILISDNVNVAYQKPYNMSKLINLFIVNRAALFSETYQSTNIVTCTVKRLNNGNQRVLIKSHC